MFADVIGGYGTLQNALQFVLVNDRIRTIHRVCIARLGIKQIVMELVELSMVNEPNSNREFGEVARIVMFRSGRLNR